MEYIVSESSIYLFIRSAIVSNIEQNMSGKMIQSMGSPKLLHSRWRGSNDSVGVGGEERVTCTKACISAIGGCNWARHHRSFYFNIQIRS